MVQVYNCSLQIYAGYCDDPRNTDNAWMETVAVNFHDDTGRTEIIPCIITNVFPYRRKFC